MQHLITPLYDYTMMESGDCGPVLEMNGAYAVWYNTVSTRISFNDISYHMLEDPRPYRLDQRKFTSEINEHCSVGGMP